MQQTWTQASMKQAQGLRETILASGVYTQVNKTFFSSRKINITTYIQVVVTGILYLHLSVQKAGLMIANYASAVFIRHIERLNARYVSSLRH